MSAITLTVPMNVCVDPAISSRLTRSPVKVIWTSYIGLGRF